MAGEFQNQQQLRVVKLDIIAPYQTPEERWNMARKLALICHYLNTRTRTGCHFFNAGVTDKSYVDPEDPNSYDEDDDSVYMRINDGFLLNNKDDDKSTFGLLSGLMDDNEVANCAHNYVSMIRQKAPGMNFLQIAQ